MNPWVTLDLGNLPLDQIYDQLNALNVTLEQSLIDNQQHNTKVRDCIQAGLHSQLWFAGMLWHNISRVNEYNYRYDIRHFENDQINFIRYYTGGHYRWHSDDHSRGQEQSRKLSFTLQLNDEYDGGEFQIYHEQQSITIPKKKGLMVIFDSRCTHRVRPVKTNYRDVLVGWTVGPHWR
jgi:hypothetical protein